MKGNTVSKIMRIAMLCTAIFFLAQAVQADDMGTMKVSKAQVKKVQNYIVKLKKGDKAVDEITVLVTSPDGNTTKVASTTLSEVGKSADPEDIDVIMDNKVVAIPEGKTTDISVPMANGSGMPSAIAGITLVTDGMSAADAKNKAVGIAAKINKTLLGK